MNRKSDASTSKNLSWPVARTWGLQQIACSIGSFTLCVLATTVLTADDRVYPKQGAAASGTLQSVTKDQVVIQVRGNDQTFPTNTVARISFDGEPSTFARCKEQTANGQWEQAREDLKKINAADLKSPEAKAEYEYYRAYNEGRLALTGKGDAAAAVRGLMAYMKANNDSHHYYEGLETLGELATLLGKYDNAAQYFAAMSKAPFREIAARSKLLEGRAYLAQNKYAEARKSASEVMGLPSSDATVAKVQTHAAVLLARCDAAEEKYDQALQTLSKLIAENDSTDADLFSRIYNAQGECFVKQNKNEQAAIAYLHTDLLFSSQADPHAEALFQLSNLWQKLGDAEKSAEAREKLKSTYPGSLWAKK